jgi:hypothetical protein
MHKTRIEKYLAMLTGGVLTVAVLIGTPAVRGALNLPESTPTLQNASPSMDTLVASFLDALAAKDRNALQQLRVTEREYIDIIMPGAGEPGKARKGFPEEKAAYFWDVLNTKSLYSEIALVNGYGGRKYTLRDVVWAKGVQQFDGYAGYAQLRLTVQDEQGEAHEIETGSVVERGGRFKFVSYIKD